MIGQKLKTAKLTGGHVFQQIGTTFELNQDIIKTNILTNFELGRDFIGTKLLTKFHEDGTRNVASRVFTTKSHLSNQFQLGRDFIGPKLLTKFHEDGTRNVVSRVFTSKCLQTDGHTTDIRRTMTGQKSSPEQSDRSSIFFSKVKGLSFSITKEGGCGGVGVGTGDGLGEFHQSINQI
ncbi:hypothetical protein DPMN_194353 [Dreissena polymorpha]|uniref:Uncharacterized protein n=1 Tax=Dreissena polymorpha TaxID=45954 RepID=A0A9D4BEN3_DREPO|nr:hypothetical protein DPMN_194353 [Dreissena polymorpha]